MNTDAGDVGAPSDTPVADTQATDAPTGDTSTADTAMAPCADPNALPTHADLGCWTCNVTTDPAPGMPGCAICRNPYATVLPRGDCYRCESDGGAGDTYC